MALHGMLAEGKRELVIKKDALEESEVIGIESGLDTTLFSMSTLNYLKMIGFTGMRALSPKIGNLSNLLQLIITGTVLETLPGQIGSVSKLKLLDISYSEICSLPAALYQLDSLQTLIISNGRLTDSSFPDLSESCDVFSHLQHLNVASNELSNLPSFVFKALNLLELCASDNLIAALDVRIGNLTNLKAVDLNRNKLTNLPYELTNCSKLKSLHLEDNPIEDRRLMKLINQHAAQKPKAVLDYIASHMPKYSTEKSQKKGKGKGKLKTEDPDQDLNPDANVIGAGKPQVVICKPPELLQIKYTAAARRVRPYAVYAAVRSLDLSSDEKFKQFIVLQTKLHDSVCKKRRLGTIATHDLAKIVPPLQFECCAADKINIFPLGWDKSCVVQEFLEYLGDRKPDAKKGARKQEGTTSPTDALATSLSKYLDLVDATEMVYLIDSTGAVLSLPPLTNSELSKITPLSTDVLLEVTSSDSLASCKKIMDSLIVNICCEGLQSSRAVGLLIEQVKVVDCEGQLLVLYPARPDLDSDMIEVRRT